MTNAARNEQVKYTATVDFVLEVKASSIVYEKLQAILRKCEQVPGASTNKLSFLSLEIFWVHNYSTASHFFGPYLATPHAQ